MVGMVLYLHIILGGGAIMDDFFLWLKKHVKLIGFVIFFLIIGGPFVIHMLFKANSAIDFFIAEWTAGEVLGYYGAVMGFLGTVILSLLALWQNQVIKNENDKREKLMQKIEEEKQLPLFKFINLTCNSDYENLKIEVTNISDNVAYEIRVENFKVVDDTESVILRSKSVNIDKDALAGGDNMCIAFTNNKLTGENLQIRFEYLFTDKLKKQHRYVISSKIDKPENFSSRNKYKVVEI